MPEGVFQTDRAIFDNPIWKNPAKFRLFFYIYGNAIFSREGVDIGGIHLSRGQLLKSYRKLSDDLEYLENHSLKKYSISHIKKLIDELVKEERLEMEISQLGTLFTVLNYEQYQGFERFEKDKSAEYRTNVPLKNLQKLSGFTSVQARTEREQPELFDTNGSTDTENTNRERSENTARTEQEQNENNNKNVKEGKERKEAIPYGEIVAYLNSTIGSKYKPGTETTREHIRARWGEKYTLEDFKNVIDKKVASWTGTDQEKYLRPETLFGTKFEGYVNEKATNTQPIRNIKL